MREPAASGLHNRPGSGPRSAQPGNPEPQTPGPEPVTPSPTPKIGLTVKLAASESWKETLTSYAAGGTLGGRSADVVTGCTSEKIP
jgi:hypothetical protein